MRTVQVMARHETGFDSRGSGETDDSDQYTDTSYQGFPASAVADRPGHERQYTLDRIERTIGSIL